MNNGKSLMNVGELAKPATTLIEKISDAIGGCFRPFQIKRVAKAEAEADRIKAISQIETQIEVADITRRALGRFLIEETNKQNNMESIISKAIPELKDDSRPNEVNNDWITNFFDKCKLVSDEEMQQLWARVLAGEANNPGKYSKRTVNFLESLDKIDASQFTALCGFGWNIGASFDPLIYDYNNHIYSQYGIDFDVLSHLNNIGFISFESLEGPIGGRCQKIGIQKRARFFYYGNPINVEFKNNENNKLRVGQIFLSKIGHELAQVCESNPVPGFLDYVIDIWMSMGLILSSPYPKIK